jgi:WD40 repeat protein
MTVLRQWRFPAMPTSRLAPLAAAVLLAACNDGGLNPAGSLTIQKAVPSGDNQTDTVLATLASPFRVRVLRGGLPAPGIAVSWTFPADSGVPRAVTSTDASGIASYLLTFGSGAQVYTVGAAIPGGLVTFTAIAAPGRPVAMQYVSGDNQSDMVNAQLGTDYTVRVSDSHDNPVAGVVIDWAVTAGGGSIAPARNVTTAPSGHASARHTLGPTDGPQTVTATANALSTVPQTFTAVAFRPGDLEVTVSTAGVDLDANGYQVTARQGLTSGGSRVINANETVTIRLRPGTYTAFLGDVAVNCETAGARLRTVNVPSGGAAAVAFDVACTTAALLVFTDGDIGLMKANGAGVTRLAIDPAHDRDPVWSPDGSKIAFVSNRAGDFDIHVMNADGTDLVALMEDLGYDTSPTWSPDGTRIAFASNRGLSTGSIYVMNADGTNLVPLTNDGMLAGEPAWSPDGAKIAFSSEDQGSPAIFVMNADGSSVTRLTSSNWDYTPTWSPDGSRIAFSRFASCIPDNCFNWERDIFVMNADGSEITQLTVGSDDDIDPAWSPDGRWIAFASGACDAFSCRDHVIKAVRADGTDLVRLAPGHNPSWRP